MRLSRCFNRLAREKSGQSLVEFGLAMPVLAALLLFTVSCGQIFSAQLVLINATREGARLGAVGQGTEAIQQTASAYLRSAGLPVDRARVEVQGASGAPGGTVAVTTRYQLSLVVPIPGLPDPLPLETQAHMRIE